MRTIRTRHIISALFTALFLTVAPQKVAAQQVTVDAKIDSLQLLIGEQAKVRLEVSMDARQKLQLPALRDTLVRGVEIVRAEKPDTQLLNEGKRWLISKEYTITSFDSALYYLPPMEVQVDGQTYRSQSLALKVYSIPVDTLHPDQFFGPKPIREVSLTWNDLRTLVWLTLLLLVLIGGFVYLYKRFRDNKPIIRRIKLTPQLPPHEQAMRDMEEIKADKQLRTDHPKAYYTALTDVLRTYMSKRFGINALEMTSFEIIEQLKTNKDIQGMQELRDLFETADLVKFAKLTPMLNENDRNLVNAIDFINETKQEPDPNAKPEPTEKVIVEKRSVLARNVLLGGLIALAIVCAIVIYFVVHNVIDLFF